MGETHNLQDYLSKATLALRSSPTQPLGLMVILKEIYKKYRSPNLNTPLKDRKWLKAI